jgi:TfoX/Sxy family transcriptional regulator of competence genes
VAEPSSPAASARWEALVAEVLASGSATYGNQDGPKRAFGSTSLKTDGRIFAMLVKGRLVVKLPAARVNELVDEGAGERFDPGHGRIQKEWLSVFTDDADAWRGLAEESEAYVGKRSR